MTVKQRVEIMPIIGNETMNNLKAQIDRRVIIVSTSLPIAPTSVREGILTGVKNFSHIEVGGRRIDFIGSEGHIPGEVNAITHIISHKKETAYLLRLLDNNEGAVDLDEMRRILSLGKRVLRRRVFGDNANL